MNTMALSGNSCAIRTLMPETTLRQIEVHFTKISLAASQEDRFSGTNSGALAGTKDSGRFLAAIVLARYLRQRKSVATSQVFLRSTIHFPPWKLESTRVETQFSRDSRSLITKSPRVC